MYIAFCVCVLYWSLFFAELLIATADYLDHIITTLLNEIITRMNIWYGSYLLLHYLLLCSVHTIKDIIKDYTLSLFKFVQPTGVTGYGHRSSGSYSVVSTAQGGGGTHCIQLSTSYTDDLVNAKVLALLASSAAGRDKFVLDSGASASMHNNNGS